MSGITIAHMVGMSTASACPIGRLNAVTHRRRMDGWSCRALVQRNMQVHTFSSTSQSSGCCEWGGSSTCSTGQMNRFIQTSNSPVVVAGEFVMNKASILPCSRPHQTYSKYSGLASSSHRRGCQSYSFSQSAVP